jgi:serine/threonine protein phosphatase 1
MSYTFAIGDIHGSLTKLKTLLARCKAHAAGDPVTFIFLGDYIDRGPQSAGVIRLLMDLQARLGRNFVALMGNHEAMALAVVDGAMPERDWLWQGADATLESYGVAHATALPREHLDWLRALRLTHDDGRRFFVHAGVDPRKPLDAQETSALLWIREPFLSSRRDYGRLIVHGHTPVENGRPELRDNRLDVDTGAVFGRPLTAAVFDAAQTKPLTFLQVD